MRLFKAAFIGNIIFVLIVIGAVIYVYNTFLSAGENVLEYIDEQELLIGEKVIVNKDTLLILDYNAWDDNFTLENGNMIAPELAKKLQLKTTE